MTGSLDDAVAVVTGGTRGIGRAAALALAAAGARVAVAGRDAKAGQEAAGEIGRSGGTAIAVVADVARRDDVRRLFTEVRSAFGPVDILIAAAGVWSSSPMLELTDEVWDTMMAVHVKGTLYCMQEAVTDMTNEGGGKIVTLTSPAATVGSNFTALHYSAAKGALIAMTKSAAKELARHRINVNCVSPAARSEMFDTLLAQISDETARKAYLGRFPLGVPEAADIAGVFTFLCSRDADFVTGQVLNADGGMVM